MADPFVAEIRIFHSTLHLEVGHSAMGNYCRYRRIPHCFRSWALSTEVTANLTSPCLTFKAAHPCTPAKALDFRCMTWAKRVAQKQ